MAISFIFRNFAVNKIRFMAIYYKYLFSRRGEITDSEGIVYSALIYRALENPEFFDAEGNLDMENVRAFISDASEESGVECIDLPRINQSKLARSVGMTRGAFIKAMKRLKDKFLVSDTFIICPLELLDGGYMELMPVEKLSAQQKVFYSFLKDRGRGYDGTIDTWASRLSEVFCTSKGNVYYLLSVLEKEGLVERQSDGKLRIK